MANIEAADGIDLRPVVFIYTLCEPSTRDVRYVGRTVSVDTRYDNHCTNSSNDGVRQWVERLRASGKRPLMVVIRRVDGWKEGTEAERDEMDRHRQSGARLFNYQANHDPVHWPSLRMSQRVDVCLSYRPTLQELETALKRARIRARMQDSQAARTIKAVARTRKNGRVNEFRQPLEWYEGERKKQQRQSKRVIRELEKAIKAAKAATPTESPA